MNGNKAVLDSNFLIFLSKGMIDLEPVRSRYEELYVSIISYIEVYAYDFVDQDQKARLDNVFDYLGVIDVKSELADQAIIYRKNKTRKIKLPDAIILAAASSVEADLITDNHKDFVNIDSSVKVISLDDFKI